MSQSVTAFIVLSRTSQPITSSMAFNKEVCKARFIKSQKQRDPRNSEHWYVYRQSGFTLAKIEINILEVL